MALVIFCVDSRKYNKCNVFRTYPHSHIVKNIKQAQVAACRLCSNVKKSKEYGCWLPDLKLLSFSCVVQTLLYIARNDSPFLYFFSSQSNSY